MRFLPTVWNEWPTTFYNIPKEFNFWKKAGAYILFVVLEETIHRFILLGLFIVCLGAGWAILLTSLIFSLSHLVKFKWQMVFITFVLGGILAAIYTQYSGVIGERIGYLFCVGIHFCFGMIAQLKGWMKKWERK